MEELHLTKDDFEIQWFSGTGGGGQHRNKHANCCRIIHKDTGLSAQSTSHKERTSNQRDAFQTLARLIISHNETPKERRSNDEVIRNYHGVRNEVHDKASGFKQQYKVVLDDISEMIEARAHAMR